MAEKTQAEKRLSLALWIGGGLLWVIVGVLLVANMMQDEQPAVASNNTPPPPVPIDGGGGLAEPTSAWDPEGIADFSLTERGGETVTQNDLLGQPWIVGFIFTRCAGPCPRVSGQMSILQDQFEDEQIRLVTMTVDPEYDTPERLQRYAKAFGAKEGWLFLTGEKENMYRYIEKNFKMPVEEMKGENVQPGFEVLHTTNLLLIDAKGVVQGAYNALDPTEIAALKKDARDLAEDKPDSDEE